ncbi:hypothetical protein DFH08DRAFT_1029136 [Mycena albidolilacea]|uniref:Uncharacterized protein n=1 Tax=Mycena albidolilacea TaxID=1033008 RepID=A0AAD6ZJ56_9AGAR|nr:hypothetical protein DFH08DRAFT_1029136 [Mycena albidolilacea]
MQSSAAAVCGTYIGTAALSPCPVRWDFEGGAEELACRVYVGTSERFQKASSKARQDKEGAYKNERLRLQLGWGKKDHADNDRLSGNGEPGRPRTLAMRPWRDGEAAMGYIRAVGARARPAVPVRCGEDEEPFGARVIDFLFFLILVLSTELRRHALDLVDLGLPAQLSQLDVQLPRARAYERRDGDTAGSPRAAYPGASGVAGVVVGGVIRICAQQRLAAPMHHSYRALRERVRVLVYAHSVVLRHAEKEGGACEASDEQGHSDESGEGGGDSGAQVNASGAEVDADARWPGGLSMCGGSYLSQCRITASYVLVFAAFRDDLGNQGRRPNERERAIGRIANVPLSGPFDVKSYISSCPSSVESGPRNSSPLKRGAEAQQDSRASPSKSRKLSEAQSASSQSPMPECSPSAIVQNENGIEPLLGPERENRDLEKLIAFLANRPW